MGNGMKSTELSIQQIFMRILSHLHYSSISVSHVIKCLLSKLSFVILSHCHTFTHLSPLLHAKFKTDFSLTHCVFKFS